MSCTLEFFMCPICKGHAYLTHLAANPWSSKVIWYVTCSFGHEWTIAWGLARFVPEDYCVWVRGGKAKWLTA